MWNVGGTRLRLGHDLGQTPKISRTHQNGWFYGMEKEFLDPKPRFYPKQKTVTYEMEDSFQNQGSSDNSGMLTKPCVLYMIIHFKHLIISFLYLDLNHTQKISSVFGGPLIKCNFSSTKGKRVFKSIMPSLTSISFFQYTHGYLTGITRKKFIVIFFS
jgi:hypothetical protein